MSQKTLSRRRFIQAGIVGGASAAASVRGVSQVPAPAVHVREPALLPKELDLAPARWIWYPCERVLQNTVVLFRRDIAGRGGIKNAHGWLSADSRYRLWVNGHFMQSGPAPADPRWPEADPVDIVDQFGALSELTLGVEVLYYGQGDGTWPVGKPGFLFKLDIEFMDGSKTRIFSDAAWSTRLAASWPPGHYKRWYLRAFQEEFDARLYPDGWTEPGFTLDENWLSAQEFEGAANKPALASSAPDYLYDSGGRRDNMQLRRRSIPMLREKETLTAQFAGSHYLHWQRPVREYFDCLTPDAYQPISGSPVHQIGDELRVALTRDKAAVITFEFKEQIVGWPFFTINAPAGTTIELMVQEAHEPYGSTERAPALMNNKFHSWTRFICKQGETRFEPFDFESFRWVQLHIHNAEGKLVIKNVGARRRIYPWPQKPDVAVSSPRLQKVIDAAVNTMNNSAQDIIVDGMARERQQYSGDVGHVLHAAILAFGATEQAARYLNTFSQGLTKGGYFMDCWPAYDRLNRIAQRQLDLSQWGPLLDHGVGFNFDCWHYYRYTGDLSALEEVYPRLVRFFAYLQSIVGEDGLLPTENLGTPVVWIEHGVSKRHVKCSFNLYTSAMLEHAFAELADAFGEKPLAAAARTMARRLLQNTMKTFWSPQRQLFVSNLPWLQEEGRIKLYDRTLATSILFDQCPGGQNRAAIRMLSEQPPELHLSYPANSGWRLWALAKARRGDKILDELESRWYKMPSVLQNNTLGEWFDLKPDSHNQWCHAPVAPLYVTYMSLAGIQPLTPGFGRVEIRPLPDRLQKLSLSCWTPRGRIEFHSEGGFGDRRLRISLPPNCTAELVLTPGEVAPFKRLFSGDRLERFEIEGGQTIDMKLTRT